MEMPGACGFFLSTPGLGLTLALFAVCYLTIRGLWTFLKLFPDTKTTSNVPVSSRDLRRAHGVTVGADYSVSSPPPHPPQLLSCCYPPSPPPPPPPLQGNLLIGMQAATRSRGALAPSLKGAAPRSSLSPSFSLSVLSNHTTLPTHHHHPSCSPSSHSCHNICSPQVSSAAGEEASDAPL